jgi:hypothetical protein
VVVFLSGTTFAFIEAPALGWFSPAVLAMVLLGVAGLAVLLHHGAHNVHQQRDIRAGVSFCRAAFGIGKPQNPRRSSDASAPQRAGRREAPCPRRTGR